MSMFMKFQVNWHRFRFKYSKDKKCISLKNMYYFANFFYRKERGSDSEYFANYEHSICRLLGLSKLNIS